MNTKYFLAGLLAVIASSATAQEYTALDACRNAANEFAKGELVKIELEFDKGVEIYEIDIKSADGSKWEFKCDKASGKILEKEQELPKTK